MPKTLLAFTAALTALVLYGCMTPPLTEANESAGPGGRSLYCDSHPNEASCKSR